MNVLVFGDSTVYGKGDTKGGWVQRLRSSIDTEFYQSNPNGFYFGGVTSLAANGGTSAQLLDRFESDLKPRVVDDLTIIIGVGLNDSSWDRTKMRNRVDITETISNLTKVIDISKKYTKDIFILGLLPVDESVADPLPWGKGYGYLIDQIAKYDNAIKGVALEAGVNFIDLFAETNNQKYINSMIRDGVHPNDEGYELIFKIVKKELESKGVI